MEKNQLLTSVTLFESIITFDQYPPAKDLAAAQEAMEGLSELEIIELAKNKDMDAINYIFDKTRKPIAKAFWTYYLGPDKKKWAKKRIDRGDAITYLNMVIEMLLSDDANPIKSFDPAKMQAKEGDLINKLGYYIMRYAQSASFKAIRSDKAGGITDSADNAKTQSLDSDKYEDGQLDLDSGDTATAETDVQDSFASWLKTLNPKDKEIMKLRAQGLDNNAIGDKVWPGKKAGRNQAAMRLKALADDFKKYIGY